MPQDPPQELYERPHWFAFRTRPRSEKTADRQLETRGFTSYLPLIEKEREWADRTKRVEFPLFPGYLFARLPLTRLSEALACPGLYTVVRLAGYPTPVEPEEIDSVRAMVRGANETGREPRPSDYLTPGDWVRVVGGPFEGMRGILTEERGRARVVVRIPALRQAVGVEMEREWLRPRDDATSRRPA